MGLTPFENHDVLASGIEMPGLSGGLNKALAVDATEWHHGDEAVFAVKARVVKVRFDPVKDTDCLQRVHVWAVDNATVIDEGVVAQALEAQRIRNEEAAGVKRLPIPDDNGDGEPDETGS